MEPILIGDLMELYQNLSMDGFRVLAVAYKDLKTREAYSKDDESELILKGYVAFLAPPYSPLCRIAGFHTFARPVARATTLGKPLPFDGVSDQESSIGAMDPFRCFFDIVSSLALLVVSRVR